MEIGCTFMGEDYLLVLRYLVEPLTDILQRQKDTSLGVLAVKVSPILPIFAMTNNKYVTMNR